MKPPCFPARPVNGGPLPKALPKTGDWSCEGKYNGWRAWVHNPTGTMFNRRNEPLSISDEFRPALDVLKGLPWEWSDVEALERRHNIGRGSLILLDYLPGDSADTYMKRKSFMHCCCALKGIETHKELHKPIAHDRVYLPMTWRLDATLVPVGEVVEAERHTNRGDWRGLWDVLQQCNTALRCEFWEGLVAKRNDSIYPRQNRSSDVEFPFWMKLISKLVADRFYTN